MYIFVKKKGGVGYSPLSPIAPRSLILFVVWTADCRSSCFKSFFFGTILLPLIVVVGLTLSQSATFIENVTRMTDSSPRISATFFYLQFLQCIFPIL